MDSRGNCDWCWRWRGHKKKTTTMTTVVVGANGAPKDDGTSQEIEDLRRE